MFRRFHAPDRDALAPLLELARHKHGADRTLWFDELRRDAPTVVARLEAVLAAEATAQVVPIARPSPKPDRESAVGGLDSAARAPRTFVA
jgi:hypothetical protein